MRSFHILKGEIEVVTGLHIGGSKDTLEIGGLDNPIIRIKKIKNNILFDQIPYIPGSSLKGKMRNLLEVKLNLLNPNSREPFKGNCSFDRAQGKTYCQKSNLINLFGTTNKDWNNGTTRLIVRDSFLNKEHENSFLNGSFQTETKTETSIERNSGKATNPRPIERVPIGIKFDFELVIRSLNETDENSNVEYYKKILILGLSLLQSDYLGGSGSRGCGQIKFNNVKWDNTNVDLLNTEQINNLDIQKEKNVYC